VGTEIAVIADIAVIARNQQKPLKHSPNWDEWDAAS
jgi:hypothetical protein